MSLSLAVVEEFESARAKQPSLGEAGDELRALVAFSKNFCREKVKSMHVDVSHVLWCAPTTPTCEGHKA